MAGVNHGSLFYCSLNCFWGNRFTRGVNASRTRRGRGIPGGGNVAICRVGGGRKANLLIISWATQNPPAAFARVSAALQPYSPSAIVQAPTYDQMDLKLNEFRNQLALATGVFLTGGSQNRIMEVLLRNNLSPELHSRFKEGIVFGGSSAGTAVMSEGMFTGEGDGTVIEAGVVGLAPGMGFVTGAIMDTHFLKRRRENRLMSALLSRPEKIGIGVDEGTAITLTDNQFARVVGPGKVMVITREPNSLDFAVSLKRPGESFEVDL